MNIEPKIAAFASELTAIRRDIHAHPELAYQETRTSDIVARKLQEWGLEVTRGRQGHDERHRRAIRIRDDRALPALGLLLQRNQREVIGVHFGNEERHELLHSKVPRVADDEVSSGGKFPLDVTGNLRIQTGEHETRGAARSGGLDNHVVHFRRTRRGQPPGKIPVFLAFRPFARSEPGDAEPGMVGELHDELLADHAGRAENADVNSAGNHCVLHV